MGFNLTSPAGACALLWSAVWLIHYLDIFEYYALSDKAVFFSFIPVLSVFLGEEIGKRKRPKPSRRKINVKRLSRYLGLNASIILFFSLVGLVSVYLIFGNPLDEGVGRVIKAARGSEGVGILRSSPFYVITQYMIISRAFLFVSFFSLIPLWLLNRKLANKIVLITVFSAVIADMSWGSRTLILDALILAVVWLAIGYPKSDVKLSRRTRIYVWVTVVFIMVALFLGAQEITASTREERNTEVQGVEIPYSVGHLLKYYSQSLVTFDQTLTNNEQKTYGLMSFGGVVNILHLLRIYRNEDLFVYDIMYDWEIENPNYADGSYNRGNIYSWLRYFYTDFGLAGLIFMPGLLGYISGWTLKKIARSPRPEYFNYVVLTICFYLVARSPLLFSLRHDYIVLGIFIAFILSKIIETKKEAIAGVSESPVKTKL